jgi:DNA-binding CsgD family transcriptional regulator/PAS domain-containing protein
MPPSGETISRLLGLLYEASANAELWPCFFRSLSDSAGVQSSFFVLVDSESRCSFSHDGSFDSTSHRAYEERYHRYDVLLERFVAAKRKLGDWIGTSQSVISDREFGNSAFYHDFIKAQGLWHQCGAALGGLDGGIEGGIAMMRAPDCAPFDKESVALLAMLAPHVRRALNTQHALGEERTRVAALKHSVEALDIAILSLDGTGRVVRMSAAAQAILDLGQGIELDGGFLRASVAGEQSRLAAMIAGAVATGTGKVEQGAVKRSTRTAPQAGADPLWTPSSGGAMVISRIPPSRPLRVVVTPFHSRELLLGDQPAALVFFSDPDARSGSRTAVLCSLYSLTPTECRLAGMIAEGCELKVAAAQLKITVDTARFHLKSVFRKTGVGRQTELVRLVLGLPCV